MLKFITVLTVFCVSSAALASAHDLGPSRNEKISVGAATSAERQLAIYEGILKLAGRKMFDIRVTAQNGFGHVMEITFSTLGTRAVQCDYEVQEISINYLQSLAMEVERLLNLQRIDREKIIDAEISSTFGTGRIAAVKLSICR